MPSTETLASYFGPPEKRLFGCYNMPHSGRDRSCAVVICQPIGHEYVNSHRALRQLAVRLAESGFPVLRFDYFGSGDSYGDTLEGRISQWLSDLSRAILELKGRANRPALCIVGLRLGASLSLMAAMQHNDVANLVLLDPIVKGTDYLKGLMSLNEELLRFRPKPRKHEKIDWPKDIIGFPMTRELYEEIGQIDLRAIRRRPADNVLIIETEDNPFQNDLKDALVETGASVSLRHVDAVPIWPPTVEGGLLVPGTVLQAVTSWMDRICP
ncbi:MAG TPA: alpha/beta hydrolase [Candidatus Acidoferrales bacterium]|nr:alpha/beta hydrolase [Candidatus Acidoferrales bacterium]